MDSNLIDLSADDAKPAASASGSAAASSSAGAVDLSEDNGIAASKPAAAAAASEDGILEVWGGDTPLHVPSPRRKKKRKTNTDSASLANVEAIDMTGSSDATSLKQTPEEKRLAEYKQTLGPLRMDFVSDQNGEAFLKTHSAANGANANSMGQIKTRKWHKELVQYALNLPITPQGSIFVRVHESRLDLVRAMITGPEGTPYENGSFFFDFNMKDYPNSPPKGKLVTTGGGSVRFNPNLYACGKICLSLLGTWDGPGWVPNKSTFLQVLISIQGLILVPDPFFNEPAYEKKQKQMKAQSDAYNQDIRKQTLRWAIEDPLRRSLDMLEGIETTTSPSVETPTWKQLRGSGKGKKKATPSTMSQQGYPEFALVVVMHFVQKAEEIETQLQEWTKLDSSLKTQSNKIRSLLKRATQQQQNFSTLTSQQPTKAAASALKRPASAKKPPPPGAEVIEIL